ncbi:AAA family ATPase [Humibacter sp. RRB41]|uniref:AAA family ATPase n=1 Tax=Humibacter sp. RRB41 TaxID=2919946 RepID=UPI002430033A|nr:AAA family ATPase [Humibacter sp. RRB41]
MLCIAHERVVQRLRERMPVIVDDTGSPRFLRNEWRAIAARTDARFALVWVRIDEVEQRRRVTHNRALGERHDVTDAVLDEHVAGFEAPGTDEHPLTIDSADGRDPGAIAGLAHRVLEG